MSTTSIDTKPPSFGRKLIKILIIVFISIFLIIWAVSSPVSKHFIKPLVLEQGLTLSDDTGIYYNPFLSQLTISDLTLYKDQQGQQEKVFSVNKLTVRLALYRLLFDKIEVSKFELNDAYLKITKTPTQLIIAGIDLNKEGSESKDIQPEEPQTETAPLPYQLVLPKLALNKINIDVNNEEKQHNIDIEALIISKVLADLNSQTAQLTLNSVIDQAELAITADVNFNQGQGEVNSQVSLSNYPLNKIQGYVKDISELSGLLTLKSKQKIVIAPKQLQLNITETKLTNNDLIVGYQKQFINLEKLENDINDLTLTLKEGEIIGLSGTSQLALHNATSYYETPNQKLAAFKQFALNDISLKFADKPYVEISSLVFDEIVASKDESSEHPALVTLKQFNISDILVSEKELAINKIFLDTLQSNVIIAKDGTLANLVALPATPAEETEDVTSAENNEIAQTTEIDTAANVDTEKSDFTISLNEFSLINDNEITLLDNSVEPVKPQKLFIDTLFLGAISNALNKRDQQTPFEFAGRSDKYTHFDFKGFTQPFSEQPKHQLKGFLKELSLPPISRYMKRAVQMELKSGQLNTDIDVTLTGEQLEGNVVILLQSLETAIADSNEAGALIDQGALPFNMALGMLKDGKGDVELDVPLSGSTSDPNFGLSSIVNLITQKAIWMATKDYLMTTFVPYANIVSAAMTVGEFALKLRFDDLVYQTKQIEPNEAQQDYLKAFIALMQDKEDTRVNICPISIPADINLTAGSKITDTQKINQLKEIGEQRGEALKDYIIKHGNIASSRLLLCAPKIDSEKEAQPRIELSV
jgi:hypothetical protein